MKGKVNNLVRDYRGSLILSFEIDQNHAHEAKRIFDREKGDLNISVKEWKDKRSLTANSYFHALVNKLAGVMGISNEDCKKMLVRSYGTVAEVNGFPVVITLPKGVDSDEYYPYCEFIYGDEISDSYQLYKQTHVLNTKEFSRLLNGTIEECKDMGLEVLSDYEIRRLYAQADKTH